MYNCKSQIWAIIRKNITYWRYKQSYMTGVFKDFIIFRGVLVSY
jgi:hypothetical protein